MAENDVKYMKIALELAKKGAGYTSPNPLVGAVVVKEDQIVGKGFHKYYGGPHAEVYALKDAGPAAKGATVYVNLEPCSHYGKTPPCSREIIKAGVKRVVIAMEDPNPLVSGRGSEQLRQAGVEVESGILKQEARKLNEVFIKYITTDYPFVFLKTAQTLDGYLATSAGNSQWITNKRAREEGHRLRHRSDAILVGIETVLADNPRLTARLPGKEGREGKDPVRIILDSQLRIPEDVNVIKHNSPAATYIVCGKEVNHEKKKVLSDKNGVELIELPLTARGRIPLRILLKELHQREFSSLLVEGGGRINYSFLREGLIDRVYAFIAPRLLGGSDGIAVFRGEGPTEMAKAENLKEVEYKILADNIMISGRF